ncbi:MAG: hypothetical protein MZU84_05815 [Sphingobacterium sp.]|nr:hypothetical protein [Sphingobacterium sp.]
MERAHEENGEASPSGRRHGPRPEPAVDFVRKYRREITIVAGGAGLRRRRLRRRSLLLRSRNRQRPEPGRRPGHRAQRRGRPEAREAPRAREAGRARAAPPAWPTSSWPSTGRERSDWAKAESYLAAIADGRKDLIHYQAEDLKAQVALGRKDYDKAIGHLPEGRRREARRLSARRRPVPPGREPRAQGRHRPRPSTSTRSSRRSSAQSYFGYEASLKAGKLALKK